MKNINIRYILQLMIPALLTVTILSSCRENTIKQTRVINPAISEIVVELPNIIFGSIVWHPSRDLVAIVGYKSCLEGCPTSIYLLTPSDGKIRIFSEGYGQDSPEWIGNSNDLSFTWNNSDKPGVYVTNISRYKPTFFYNASYAAWSRDGKYVALVKKEFDKNTSEKSSELSILKLDTRDEKLIYQTPWSLEARIQGVTWSPDGNDVAFATTWFQGQKDEDHIYVMKADGTLLYKLTENLDNFQYPEWMLDGKWLMFVYGKEQRLAFFNVEQNCVVPTEITGVGYPSLSPDGKSLLYTAGKIYKVDLSILLGSNFEALKCAKQ